MNKTKMNKLYGQLGNPESDLKKLEAIGASEGDAKCKLLAALNHDLATLIADARQLGSNLDASLWNQARPLLDQSYRTRADQMAVVQAFGMLGKAYAELDKVRELLGEAERSLNGL